MNNNSSSQSSQPVYRTVSEMLDELPGHNGQACRQIYSDFEQLFQAAPGSSHNHQTWPGGYIDHITDAMNIVSSLYDTLVATGRSMPFTRADALLVVFLHDLEKPFKFTIDEAGNLTDNLEIPDKAARAAKRLELMAEYGIDLNTQQDNAFTYIEGVRDHEYTPERRTMGELAALCHCADVLSARMWYNYPLPPGQDEWPGAHRLNGASTGFVLKSELE